MDVTIIREILLGLLHVEPRAVGQVGVGYRFGLTQSFPSLRFSGRNLELAQAHRLDGVRGDERPQSLDDRTEDADPKIPNCFICEKSMERPRDL
jgi:hypothetical protein